LILGAAVSNSEELGRLFAIRRLPERDTLDTQNPLADGASLDVISAELKSGS